MARPETKPEIKIGGLTFQPIQMNLWERVKAHFSIGAGELAADFLYPDNRQYWQVAASLRIAVLYGSEAADAFDTFITPQVRSTTELQRLRQMGTRVPRWQRAHRVSIA